MMISRRKQYIINPRFQYLFIFVMILISIINTFIFFCASYYMFFGLSQKALDIGLRKGHVFFSFINQVQYDFFTIGLIGALVSFMLLFIFGAFWSNKIAGPIFRLKVHLSKVNSLDELEKVGFRQNDYFSDLELEFNNMVSRIHKGRIDL